MSTLPEKKPLVELDEFAAEVGQFMEYWGFKRIHGLIWTHIYLAEQAMDATELMRRLNISKALVSISLKELLEFSVIEEAGKSERGTRLYKARENLGATILDTLRRRERKMMAQIRSSHSLLERLDDEEFSLHGISRNKVALVGMLIRLVEQSLDQLIKKQNASVFELLALLSQSFSSMAKNPNTAALGDAKQPSSSPDYHPH